MPKTKLRSVAEARQEAEEAVREADRLANRVSEIDAEIAREQEKVTRGRIESAKRGRLLSLADARGDLERLEEERKDLPLEHFGAQIRAAAAHIAAEQARIDELRPKARGARSEFERLAERAARAQAEAEEAELEMRQLEGAITNSEAALHRHEKQLDRLEAAGPRSV